MISGKINTYPVVLIRSERGVALLLVLWIITILMVIVMSFSFLTKTEANSTFFFKEGTEKKLLAEAGLERAKMEIIHRQTYRLQAAVLEGNEVVTINGKPNEVSVGSGKYVFILTQESGKININTMNDVTGALLNTLLKNLGISEDQADVIVDSIMDWVDKDDVHRLHGAENQYYESLPKPYKTKNGPVDTLEELLLVKGMTPDILFGTKERKGLLNFLTVYGTYTKININSASKELLLTLPGITEDLAQKIIEQRNSTEFRTEQDVQAVLGTVYSGVSKYVDVTESEIYGVETLGFRADEKKGYGIRAVVLTQGDGTFRYLYYKSPAEIRE